jgi:hypothetical protein
MRRIKLSKHGPEWYIQNDLIEFLEDREWLVERMIGNALQKGIPDLYCHHPSWGERWIDVKNPKSYSFTKDQRRKWPIWEKYGVGIWILTAADQEEYDKLFHPPNWRKYWKKSWDKAKVNIDEADIDELIADPLIQLDSLVVFPRLAHTSRS